MIVIVANKQKDIIDNKKIDSIKNLYGTFDVDDLINSFKNFFFSKMILDATSITGFTTPDVLKKLAEGIGADRLIILLPEKPSPPQAFLDLLVSLGIYNFSTNINDVIKFVDNPNSYDDIKNNSINDNFYNNQVEEETDSSLNQDLALEDDIDILNEQKEVNNLNQSNNLTNNTYFNNINNLNDEVDDSNNINENKTNDNINMSNTSNINMMNQETISSNITNDNMGDFIESFDSSMNNQKKVICFKNLTSHAGSTTLVYLLTKMLINKYHKDVLAIEVNKNDFSYFHEKNMIDTSENDLKNTIANSNAEIILIDANECDCESMCNEIIYLLEPSIIKLNQLMMRDKNLISNVQNKKIILNKSFLSKNDLQTLQNGIGVNLFFNIPPLNDRIENIVLEKLFSLLKIL